MTTSYFTRSDGDWFRPTEYARGPWDEASCHAGPVTALLVRAIEQLVEDKQLVRITVELLRPVPMSGFAVRASVVRTGRSVSRTNAEVYDDEAVFAQAVGVHIRTEHLEDVPTPQVELPNFGDTVAGPFNADTLHDAIWFADGVECRFPSDADVENGGPLTIWMRNRVATLPGEASSPFEKLAPLADCANGVSRNGKLGSFSPLNVDLTMSLVRPPIGDWFGSQSISHWQPNGIGQTDAELFDQHGRVGRAMQSLLLGGRS